MSVLSSAHAHTTYCDGKSTAAEMAKAAWERGFVSLGFSGHAPQHFDTAYCMSMEGMEQYKAEVRALQKEYQGRMTIYLGTERDRFACVSPEGFDYFIGSVHYIPWGEDFAPVDGDPVPLARYLREECGGNGLQFVQQYFTLLRDYILAARPAIIGHFDLVRKNNVVLHHFDEESPAYQTMALEALEPLAQTGAFLEVNTGAIGRGTMTAPYPAPYLLKAWKQWGGEVMINSDCHNAAKIDIFYPECEEMLRSLGYDHAVRLGKNAMWERFSL